MRNRTPGWNEDTASAIHKVAEESDTRLFMEKAGGACLIIVFSAFMLGAVLGVILSLF